MMWGESLTPCDVGWVILHSCALVSYETGGDDNRTDPYVSINETMVQHEGSVSETVPKITVIVIDM